MEQLIRIAQRYDLDRDDLIIEAEVLETCGQYLHIVLLGYSPEELRAAAKQM